jgi:hypothetical protein
LRRRWQRSAVARSTGTNTASASSSNESTDQHPRYWTHVRVVGRRPDDRPVWGAVVGAAVGWRQATLGSHG